MGRYLYVARLGFEEVSVRLPRSSPRQSLECPKVLNVSYCTN